MRGTKLTAWRLPPVWGAIAVGPLEAPAGSSVLSAQERMFRATREVLTEIASDIRGGLLETVGIESSLNFEGGRCSIILALPPATDCSQIAAAIEAENLEAWVDGDQRVNIGVNPSYSTKDVDQTVLCATKVVHVLLGLHAVCEATPLTLKQRMLSSIADVLNAQRSARESKD